MIHVCMSVCMYVCVYVFIDTISTITYWHDFCCSFMCFYAEILNSLKVFIFGRDMLKIKNSQTETTWEESIVACVKVLLQYFCGRSVTNHEISEHRETPAGN